MSLGIDTTSNDEIQRLAREVRTQIGAPPLEENEPDLIFQALLQVVKDEREACVERASRFANHSGQAGQMAKQIYVSLKNRGVGYGPFGGQFQMQPEKPGLGNPEYLYADSHEEIIRGVRENVHYGATVIKLIIDNQPYYYSVDDVRVAVEEAHDMGVKVMAHAVSDEGIRRAVLGGVDSIEHGFNPTDETLRLMKENGTYLVGTDFPASRVGEARYQSNIDRNRRAYDIGVPMAFGSDVVYYEEGKTRGEQTVGFLFSYVDAGLPNEHILRMATMYAADLLGANSGRLEAGRNADVVAMSSNPLDDINALYDIDFVMKDGTVYKRDGEFEFDLPLKLNNPRRKQPRGNMLRQN